MNPSKPLSPDLEQLARSWLRYATEKAADARDSWFDAAMLAEHEPEKAWELTEELIKRVPDQLLDHVSANILERILEHHAVQFVDRVEARAKEDPRFRECLSTVWLVDDYAPPAVLERINAATGNRLDIIPRMELDRMEREDVRGA
jgi:hypothetical protein